MTIKTPDESTGTPAPEAAPAAPASPPPEAPAPDAPAASAAPESTPAPTEPAYQPSYKYRVGEKEFEFDEPLRPLVKDKSVEDKLRDLYTASHGIVEIKSERDSLRQEVTKFAPVQQELTRAARAMQKGDLDTAFSVLGIPEDKVLSWVQEKIRIESLPDEQKHMYHQKRQAELAKAQLEERNNSTQSMLEQTMVQMRTMELNMVLGRDDVRGVAEAYDARVGKPGAFREQVKQYGMTVFATSGRDLSAEEAAVAVANQFKPFLGTSSGGAGAPNTPGAGAPAQPHQTVIIEKNAQPSIPAVGKPGSPGKAPVKRISDLTRILQEKTANGG